MKGIIFGCGGVGIKVKDKLEAENISIIAYADNNEDRWNTMFQGKKVISPKKIIEENYDFIAIGVYKGVESIRKQLLQMGVQEEKIIVPIKVPHRIFANPKIYTQEELTEIPIQSNISISTEKYKKLDIKINDNNFLSNLEHLKIVLYQYNIPRKSICIVSGAVLQVFNLRQSKKFDDIDIIMTSDLRNLYGSDLVIVSEIIEMHPQNENYILDDEIIQNVDNHFIFNGLKFLNIELLYEFSKRNKRAIEEIRIMEKFLGIDN